MIVGNPIPNTKMKIYMQRHNEQNFVTFSGRNVLDEHTFRVPDEATIASISHIAHLLEHAQNDEATYNVLFRIVPSSWEYIGEYQR